MKRFLPFSLFFLFILWVIWQADSNGTNYLFNWVERVPFKDKIGHFTLYGILAVLFDVGLNHANWLLGKMQLSKAAVFVIAFAFLEEVTQLWIPARNFDAIDGLADVLGVFSLVYGMRWARRLTRFRNTFRQIKML